MKQIVMVALLVMSSTANAGMWMLEKQDYVYGTGWICTYRLSGTDYISTLVQKNLCKQWIND